MRKRRKIKWVVALVVSFVFMMLAPAISNHPVQAEQSSTEENQTDKPWVTSLPFVTISEYNESAGTKKERIITEQRLRLTKKNIVSNLLQPDMAGMGSLM